MCSACRACCSRAARADARRRDPVPQRAPWGLVLVHVTLGATIWGLTVAIAYALWRPPLPLVAPPSERVERWRAAAVTLTRYAVVWPRATCASTERPTLRRPVMITAFRGWNDGGQAATVAAGYLAQPVGRDAVRGHRPRGLRRLPGRPPDGHARRGDDPAHRVAGERVLPRRDPGDRPRRGDPPRRRAELPLARVHRPRGRPRARARRRARRDARRAAGRRAAHASRAGDRGGDRSRARRGARAPALALRGADRHRRRPPRRLPRGRAPRR